MRLLLHEAPSRFKTRTTTTLTHSGTQPNIYKYKRLSQVIGTFAWSHFVVYSATYVCSNNPVVSTSLKLLCIDLLGAVSSPNLHSTLFINKSDRARQPLICNTYGVISRALNVTHPQVVLSGNRYRLTDLVPDTYVFSLFINTTCAARTQACTHTHTHTRAHTHTRTHTHTPHTPQASSL